MLPKKNLFELFCIKPHFDINKNDLKKKYFELARINHPDVSGDPLKFKEIAQAYNILSNDLLRARYLNNSPIKEMKVDFLSEVLEMEEEIESLDDLSEMFRQINGLIEECRRNYKDVEMLSRWIYYERLLSRLKDREASLEISKFR